MINLLPPAVQQDITYARRNKKLLRWCVAMVVAICGLLTIVIAGQLYLNKAAADYSSQIELSTAQLKAQKLDDTQKRVSEFSSNLQLAVQVLSKQVLYSKFLKQLGAAIPQGALLTDLRISKLEGGIDLQFNTTSEQTATAVQRSLEDPNNKIFEKADILSVTCPKSSLDPKYPCRVSIRALFSKSNSFLITNSLPASGATR
jgi:Tfp pilus assembly protein PilN